MPRMSGWCSSGCARRWRTAASRAGLLIPDVVELDEAACDRLEAALASWPKWAGDRAVRPAMRARRAMPALLGQAIQRLVTDLADELGAFDEALSLKEKLDEVAATMAVHGSVRADGCCRWRR
jgi:DNA mismatch repair protein MutL